MAWPSRPSFQRRSSESSFLFPSGLGAIDRVSRLFPEASSLLFRARSTAHPSSSSSFCSSFLFLSSSCDLRVSQLLLPSPASASSSLRFSVRERGHRKREEKRFARSIVLRDVACRRRETRDFCRCRRSRREIADKSLLRRVHVARQRATGTWCRDGRRPVYPTTLLRALRPASSRRQRRRRDRRVAARAHRKE